MRWTMSVCLGLALAACGDDGEKKTDTSSPETVAEVTETTETEVVALTTWDDVYAIFTDNCSGCHTSDTPTGGPSGGHSIASTDKDVAYLASQNNATLAKCAGKTVGECALIRIKDGSMPATGDCSDDPPGEDCPTAAEQAILEKWIADGQRKD